MQNKDFLTIQEVTMLYGLSKNNQNLYRMQKKIPYIKIGKKIFYEKVKLDEWFKSFEVKAV